MALMTFEEFRAAQTESSPSTRNKLAAAQGLQPMYSADVFGHATPPPAVAEKLLGKLKSDKKKKDKKNETAVRKPDRSFDDFINKAEKAADDVAKDLENHEKEDEKMSKEIDALARKPKKPEQPANDDDDVMASLTKQVKPESAPKIKKEKKPEKPKKPAEPKQDFTQKECNEWDSIFSSSIEKD